MEVSKANINLIDSYKQAKDRIRQLEAEVGRLKERLSQYEGGHIVAVLVWTVDEIEDAIRDAGYKPTNELMNAVVQRAKGALGDYSDGWETLDYIVRDCVEVLGVEREVEDEDLEN